MATIVAPAADRANEMLLPMPREAPVTTAILPFGIQDSPFRLLIGKCSPQFRLGNQLPVDVCLAGKSIDPASDADDFELQPELVSRHDRFAELRIVYADKIGNLALVVV